MEVSASLNHPNIVGVQESLTENDPPALVMDYVDGENLEKFHSRLPYVLPEVSAFIVIEILKALEYAHDKGLIHRDLKPENVLIRKDGQVFVTDFGLAKYADATLITQTNVLMGSLDYMAPEQACGDTVTAKSDLFSVGLILYFLTTGMRPFSRPNAVATLTAIREESAESPQKCNPKISGEFARIMQKAIDKRPTHRYQTAAEFRRALESYLTTLGLVKGTFDFALWSGNPTTYTLEGLRVAADALIARCETSLKYGRWDDLLEKLAHLSLKAPQSAALSRIAQSYQHMKKRRGRRAGLPIAIVGLLSFLGLGLWAPWKGSAVKIERIREVSDPVPAPTGNRLSPAAKLRVAETGSVIFKVAPEVKVYWNGRLVDSKTPLKNQPVGEHDLILKRPGFKAINTRVQVRAEEPVVVNVK